MTCAIQARGAIELYFYGELSASERADVQAHLVLCGECRQALDDLRAIRAALASRPDVAAPAGGDWSAFMARLDAAVHERPAPVRPDGRFQRRRVHPIQRIAPYLALAALLTLVTASVLIFRGPRRGPAAGSTSVAAPPPASAPAPVRDVSVRPDAALASLSGQHFKRSKLVLLGITTKDASKPHEDDWAYERDLAGTLLGDTRLYRQAAEERGMVRLAGVMRDLELVLLQTSMSDAPDTTSLEQLQRLIRRRDLLTKMDVVYEGGS